MNTTSWIIIGVVVIVFLLLKRASLVGVGPAQEWLAKGAKIIDVRSEGEYGQGHVKGAINLPLNRLGQEIAQHAPDKEQPLLLHCLSGGRSAVGKAMLRRLGYRNVFNLGSYRRAERVVGGTQ